MCARAGRKPAWCGTGCEGEKRAKLDGGLGLGVGTGGARHGPPHEDQTGDDTGDKKGAHTTAEV